MSTEKKKYTIPAQEFIKAIIEATYILNNSYPKTIKKLKRGVRYK